MIVKSSLMKLSPEGTWIIPPNLCRSILLKTKRLLIDVFISDSQYVLLILASRNSLTFFYLMLLN